MIFKTILALAYTIALPGYGAFVNVGKTYTERDAVVMSAADGAADTELPLYAGSSLGTKIHRHGSICRWSQVLQFGWCSRSGSDSAAA